MLCNTLGHGHYQNWASLGLHLTQALILVMLVASGEA